VIIRDGTARFEVSHGACLEFPDELAAHCAFEVFEAVGDLEKRARTAQHLGAVVIHDRRGVGLTADDEAVHGNPGEVDGTVGAARRERVVVRAVARNIDFPEVATGRGLERQSGAEQGGSQRGWVIPVASGTAVNGLCRLCKILTRSDQRPIEKRRLRVLPAPFEGMKGDRLRSAEDRFGDLGRDKRVRKPFPLQAILTVVDRCGYVERQHEGHTAGLHLTGAQTGS